VPDSLVYPKFEMAQLVTQYESIFQTSFLAVVAPCNVVIKVVAVLVLVLMNGYVLWICAKIVQLSKKDSLKFEADTKYADAHPGFVSKHITGPMKIAASRLKTSEPPGSIKGEWKNGDGSSKTDAFMGGYSELFGGYTGPNVLLCLWDAFLEKALRVFVLLVIPGVEQGIILTVISLFTLVTYICRMPLVERNLNYQAIFGKAVELFSFAYITIGTLTNDIKGAAALVLAINQVGIYVMIVLSIFDAVAKLKGLMCKKKDKKDKPAKDKAALEKKVKVSVAV
jgi:hypothetical protein